MAKDPAFLFYPGDWLGGTITLSRLQKGCYMDLLVAQFNNGPLSLEKIRTVLGQDQATWTVLSSKFKQDSDGLFYNERLATEVEKRKGYIESRTLNGMKKGKAYALAHGKHMVKLPENENKDENIIQIRTIEECLKIAIYDKRWAGANKTSEHELHLFNGYLERLGMYEMNPIEYKKYFAKLKGKYPELVKKKFTVEELREMAKEMDKETAI